MKLGIERPPCPRGHAGRIHLDGYIRNRTGTSERPRFRCLPDDGETPAHTFMPPLRHRHSTHPDAASCQHCEREMRRTDGPAIANGCEFSVREAAHALVRLGQSQSYRGVGEELRLVARKPSRSGRGVSNEAGLALDYTDAFADLVIGELGETAWPDILLVDAQPFRIRLSVEQQARAKLMYPGSNKKQPKARKRVELPGETKVREVGRVLGAMGQDKPGRLPRPILFRFMGGGDAASWVAFFRSLPGRPSFIVSDRDKTIINAVKTTWPVGTPVHYFSHPHLIKNAAEAAEKDGVEKCDPIRTKLEELLISPERTFGDLRAEAARRRLPELAK